MATSSYLRFEKKPNGATIIFEDNQAAICMAQNPQLHGRAKHIDIKYHFIREQVNSGAVSSNTARARR